MNRETVNPVRVPRTETAAEAGEARQTNDPGRIREDNRIYARLLELTGGFLRLYVIDPETDRYRDFSASSETMAIPGLAVEGTDFFGAVREAARATVHPDDLDRFLSSFTKENVVASAEEDGTFFLVFRLIAENQPEHIRLIGTLTEDGDVRRLIIGFSDIDAEIREQISQRADQQKSITYTRIAERLAAHFDRIYYVDCETSEGIEFSTKKKTGKLKTRREINDFFAASAKDIERLVDPEDRDRVRSFLNRDYLITNLAHHRKLTIDYRMIVGKADIHYTRMTATYASDRTHFILCVESRDDDVRREQEYLAALAQANEMARRDELTRVRNKTAYHETEKELQREISEGEPAFGIAVFDINGLKEVNDTEGHRAGDEYIKAACAMICHVFQHSPVFRIGGDEFVAVLRDEDYENRGILLAGLRKKVEKRIRTGRGPAVASAIAEFDPGTDRTVADVFNRADQAMYRDKERLREQKQLREIQNLKTRGRSGIISEERRNRLDDLFEAFEIISEGTYIFLCDMKYNYSRWSRAAVDVFGLPSEYMFEAGDIWGSRVHPEDRKAYTSGIEAIFAGAASEHDMQYRVRRADGEYDVCTCRGTVIMDEAGEPEYFGGAIRNQGAQSQMDSLTGLRNQYGFFEDLDGWIRRNARISIILFNISRFREINEMHGYHFGNRVLQQYARRVYQVTENEGHSYRIDGTKFATISSTLTIPELRDKYDRFRASLREDFRVDGRKILLELNCGALRVDSTDVNSQTVYACLNFALEESKNRQRGGMVEFRNELNAANHRRLEILNTIRESVFRGYAGFHLLYQPVVDAETEELIGAEALLRWQNDRYGMVPPDAFVPVLETDALFPQLGDWILREALSGAARMLKNHPNFMISVNLSYSQLENPEFVSRVLQMLRETGFPADHLCLEITERCRLLDLELLQRVVVNLQGNGIQVAMDDFGTGFSSVGILKEIPFDTIKIDRSFVQRIEESETDRKAVQGITGLASIFDNRVCVEGVETAGMRDILRHFRVNSFQGYYYGRPQPMRELQKWEKPGAGKPLA